MITLFGAEVRSFLPSNPALDLTGRVLARIVTKVTRPDGSTDESVSFEYGMRTCRDPLTGEMRVALDSSFAPAAAGASRSRSQGTGQARPRPRRCPSPPLLAMGLVTLAVRRRPQPGRACAP